MKILITGNMGYVGPVVVKHLKRNIDDVKIFGLDTGYFSHLHTGTSRSPESYCDAQYFGDIRNVDEKFLTSFDALILLAAISNDPMGQNFEKVTHEINNVATKDLIKKFRPTQGKTIVFASSCSIYGSEGIEKKKENSPLNPLTAYAKSKVKIEDYLSDYSDSGAKITCLRFATACGMSDRFRLDLVLNDCVASAFVNKNITILSDGSPWRPLIDVRDMAKAIEWSLKREKHNENFLAINVGSNDSNYQIKELGERVKDMLPGTTLDINKNAFPDKRSYRVDFTKFEELAVNYLPSNDLEMTINELLVGLKSFNFADKNFRESNLIRLKAIEDHKKNRRLNQNLFWI